MPPHFYRYSEDRVEAFYRALRQAVNPRIPLHIYRVPFFASDLSLASARRLLDEGLYAGLIDAAHHASYLEALAPSLGAKLLGNEAAWSAQRPFAHGVLSACASAVPELIAGLDRAHFESNPARVALLLGLLAEFTTWIDRFPVPFGFMEAARLRGLPIQPDSSWLAAAPLAEFREWFPAWLPGVVRTSKTESGR
jgi:dihydrodipicolinate synthase/N-acetylneuraminate lyase